MFLTIKLLCRKKQINPKVENISCLEQKYLWTLLSWLFEY